MKLKAAISGNASIGLVKAFGSEEFAWAFLQRIVGTIFEAKNSTSRPAEYYIQEPDLTVALPHQGVGIEVRLTGVSRDGRTTKVFHDALKELGALVAETAIKNRGRGEDVQTFVVIMLDKEVETEPGSGRYSNVLETESRLIRD